MNTKLIKLKLVENDITIEDIANKIDINPQTISNWINGRNLKYITKFIKLLILLDINIKDLDN